MSTTASQLPHSGAPAASSEQTSLPVLILVLVLIIGPMIVLTEVIAYWRTDVVDDQMFAYYGWRILHGATVYLDVWDNKPPGVYWANALGMALGGGQYLGVIVLCGVAMAVAHAAFFIGAAAVYHRSAAALTTLLLAFYLLHAFFTGGSNRTETFLVPLELIGVAFYLHAFRRDRWWMWYLAGLFCGAAFLFKQVGLAAWGCMGLHLLLLAALRDIRVSDALVRGLLLLGGCVTTLAAAAAYLASQGALEAALFATFVFNRAYVAVGSTQFPYSYANLKLLQEHVREILLAPFLMAVAALIHAFLWWLRPQHRPQEIERQVASGAPRPPRFLVFFVLWLLVAWFGALLSPHGFRHYVLPTIPPLVFLAGYLVNVLRAETNLLRRLERRAWVTVAFLILIYFAGGALHAQLREASRVWIYRVEPALTGEGQFDVTDWEIVGRAVAEVTDPDDTIQCWGYLPGVYLTSRRMNATRYTTTEKVGQVGGEANFIVEEMEKKLLADPPVLLVLSATDYEWMRGTLPGDRPSDFHLGGWIDEHYVRVREVVEDSTTFYLFKRADRLRPDQPSTAAAARPSIAGALRPATGARRARE